MHTLRLKLKTNRRMKRILEKRYHMIAYIHNKLVKHVKKQLTKLKKKSRIPGSPCKIQSDQERGEDRQEGLR